MSSSENWFEHSKSRFTNVRKQVLLITRYFTTIPGDRVAGRVLDIAKIQLTQPSLEELGLGLRLAINKSKHSGKARILIDLIMKSSPITSML